MLNRRLKHEPAAYIAGCQPFMSLDFFVNRSVLIPRPETELLVENAIKTIKNIYDSPHLNVGNQNLLIADIGTGSGCIAVSLAKYLPNVSVIGIDSSPEVIEMSINNAKRHEVDDRCQFIIGNMLEPLKEKVDIVVSNPPYIPSADIETLQSEVKAWEPRHALDGGPDGLDYIKKLIAESPDRLNPKGVLLFEFGFNQVKKIKELIDGSGRYKEIEIINDYSGKPRILKATL
jgi:release factor glutamine methyltransferase